jgi:magnesium transporter
VLSIYTRGADGRVAKAPDARVALAQGDAIWIDLHNPEPDEERLVEAALDIDAPTKAERAALEDSARFYEEKGALFLTATVLASRDGGRYAADAVSFVLTKDRLITVREIDTRALQIGEGRASARVQNAMTGGGVFMALIEGIFERVADILAETSAKAQTLSQNVFITDGAGPELSAVLSELGRLGGVVSQCHDSLTTLERLAAFSHHVCEKHALPAVRLAAFAHDADQLERTADALQNHLTFLLDAALGLVAAAQNNSLQRLSTLAMVFVPSTLLAGVFGMNFKAMTIFDAPWGPWAGFGLMAASTIFVLVYARRRRWI